MARPSDEPARRDDVERDDRTGARAAETRIRHQEAWVDLQVRQAIARGDFDDLPGLGKPIEDLGSDPDPDWWLKRLIEREQITGVLPPSLQIRREDAELDARLDRLRTEDDVRRAVAEFNARVRWALYRPPEGPPVVTPQRDVDAEVARWRTRLEERRTRRAAADVPADPPPRRRLRRKRRPLRDIP